MATVSLLRWRARLPEWAQRCCDAWLVALGELDADIGLSDRARAQWRAIVIADVVEQCELLEHSSPAVHAAWGAWYPSWVRDRVRQERLARDELFWSEATAREMQSERDRAIDAARKAVDYLVESEASRARQLLAMLHDAENQMIRWEPLALARRLTGTRGPIVDLLPLADTLVRAGAAEWRRYPSGRPWALLATGSRLPEG